MASFRELVEKYRKQQQGSAVADSLAVGLSLVDDLGSELGLLADSPVLGAISLGLPITLIAASEGSRVFRRKKTGTAACQDAGYRMLRTGAAMGLGAAVVSLGGSAIPAIPIAAGTRMLLDNYRSRSLTAKRVAQRTLRLRALRQRRQSAMQLVEALPE